MTQAEPSAADPRVSTPGLFAATRWTVVLAARLNGADPAGSAALEELCRIYWKPLHAYARREGFGDEDARDFTQEFFARLLARPDRFAGVDRAKGKFRSFLLASLKHFLANERDKARALKRGGGEAPVPLDALGDALRQRLSPASGLSPDQAFDRQWALTLLDRVLARLRAEYVAGGKMALFETLKPFLMGDRAETAAEAGKRCGLSEGALKVSVHRLRRRYRGLLRDEIAQTVADPAEIDGEIRALFEALR